MRLVKPDELGQLASISKRLVPLDATWFPPDTQRDGAKEFQTERLPHALFFDLDRIKAGSPLPLMLPSRRDFEAEMSRLGVENSDTLVVYDKLGIFSSPRAVFILETFRHPFVYLLDSYTAYQEQGLPLVTGEPVCEPNPSCYEALNDESTSNVATYEQLVELVRDKEHKVQILDARPTTRFNGTLPEPKPGMAAGHIPGSKSTPFTEVLISGRLKTVEELKSYFENKQVSYKDPIIVTCSMGLTACVIRAALRVAGYEQPIKVYDGSWAEWGMRAPPDLIEKS